MLKTLTILNIRMNKVRKRYVFLPVMLMLVLVSCAQIRNTAEEKNLQQRDSTVARQWWCYPLPGAKVISPFGGRGGRRHTGVDIKTKANDKILAAFDGEVVFSQKYYGYGNLVRIRHENGLETYYSHNSKNLVKVGDIVKAGDVIALTGQTGRATTPHLHFETRIGGKAVNPAIYFDHEKHAIRLKAFNKKKDGYVIKRSK